MPDELPSNPGTANGGGGLDTRALGADADSPVLEIEWSEGVLAEGVLADTPASDHGASKRRKMGIGFWIPMAWIGVVVFCAITASWLPLDDRNISDFRAIAKGPSSQHWLGTDEIGRDILARLVHGSRVSLSVGIFAVAIGMLGGGIIGLLAGYYRGKVETVLMAMVDIMLAFPALILAIAIVVFMGQSLRNVTIAIAILAIPAFARITRAATLSFAQREFVTAARAMGARDSRILLREILPNVALPVAAFGLVVVAVAIVAEGGLAFLSLSVPRPEPSWGSMIESGRGDLNKGIEHISLIPATVMALTVLSFNLVGDKLRSLLDVKEGAI